MTSSPVSRVVYNGKRPTSSTRSPSSSEIFTPAHEENVRFIYEAWQSVERDLRNQVSGGDRGFVEEYVEKQPSNNLKCGTSDLSGCCPGRLSRNTVTGQRGSSGSHWKRMPTASIVQTAARRREKKLSNQLILTT
ncbi:mapk-regulated corepressor-interacting protein 1 isoform X1 [Aquarana catesbeiana]|uniref:mapk-regulated corepressor-interacting protein 1 isoform X1 n=1 Tax=Aquarana catesbeiana TaxID=8400 RepID=UPI003CC97257